MAAEKKRPRGLAAQKAAKKAKVEQEAEEVPDTSKAQTVVLDKVVEEGDEVGEAAALFESALEKAESDPEAALQLLRGTVHESDRILRNWPENEPRPPPQFYLTYGSALYELGRLQEDEDFEPYLEAAEERLESGLERCEELEDDKEKAAHAEWALKIRVALSKVWIAKAASSVTESEDQVPELASRALETLSTVLDSPDHKLSNASLVEIASIVQSHGELYSDLESQNKFRNWAQELLERVVKEEPQNARALSELGLGQLSLANYWLEQVDMQQDGDDKDDQEKKERSAEEQKAYDAIVKCKKYFKQSLDVQKENNTIMPQSYADLAEACLNEANLVLQENEQSELYQEAVKYIQEAKSLAEQKQLDYTLPEGLQSFLDEFNEQ